jgi:hypothetical protein
MERIFQISIDYSKLETVIKIDIKQRNELSIIPTFSVGIVNSEFLGNLDLNEYLNDLFDKNFTAKPENNTQYSMKEIYGQSQGRKILSINSQHKQLDRFVSLKLGNEVLNLSKFSRSYDNLVKLSKIELNANFSRIFSTFILDFDSLERITDKNEREIFTVLFDFEKFRKFKRSFIRQKLILYIHSNSFESFKKSATKQVEPPPIFERRKYLKLYKLIGTKQTFIENGKEICSHYNSKYRPFNAFSQSSCLRKCFQNYCQKRFKCSPLVIKEIISSIDEEENEMKFCSKELSDLCDKALNDKNISKKCTKYCPKDCIQFDIQLSEVLHSHREKESDDFTEEKTLVWDNNYPLIFYIETRVMAFTDYLCYCGGLFGLWFGSNANQVLTYALNLRNWISLKDKFMNIFQILLSMIWRIVINFLEFLLKLHFRLQFTIY